MHRLPPLIRSDVIASNALDVKKEMFSLSNRCHKCWLLPCQCSLLFKNANSRNINPRICVYMDSWECYRITNTGHLIDSESIFFANDFASENNLLYRIRTSRNPCILFPEANKGNDLDNMSTHDDASPDLVVVPDSTWPNANKLYKRIQTLATPMELKCVGFYTSHESEYLLRTQTCANRICTIEAVSMFLRKYNQIERAQECLDRFSTWKTVHANIIENKHPKKK
jgi:DTW domain-containing protein YfiP